MDYDDDDFNSAASSDVGQVNITADGFDFLKPQPGSSDNVPGLTCEVKLYEARYNTKGDRPLLAVGKHKDREPQAHRDHDAALTFLRWYNWDKQVEKTELIIRSPYLKEALKQVIKEYPGVNLKATKISISGLPKCLFHYRNELQQYGLLLEHDSAAFEHLLLLLRHMWEQIETQWANYYGLMENPLLTPGLEFADLWMAFRPGTHLYRRITDHHQVVKMEDMTKYSDKWRVTFVYIDNDGDQLGFVEGSADIHEYDGYRPLESLKIYPLEYHSDKNAITRDVVKRGKKMVSLRGVHYRMYTGTTEALGTRRQRTLIGEIDGFPLQSTSIKSRVMVDAGTFGRVNPCNQVDLLDGAAHRLPKVFGTEEYDLSDEHFMICDYHVAGFALADKTWCWLEVDKISDVDFNVGAFEKLLLPQEQKDMIHSLVEVHTNNNLSFDDVIKGKGKGMVFLLHGVPGVGKTLTAESVADQTKRPLYTISCGELGVQPAAVEKNLKAALDLATTWNAIALIDEADIFLEERSMHDLERNSLVSIFLRLLEYYEGILILTTNRIEAFDKAFKSRIHLAIKYHALSPEYRAQLWKSFIANTAGLSASEWLPDDVLLVMYPWMTNDYLLEIGKEDLNGRQIKNTVRTAHALAVSAGVLLWRNHIDTALRAMRMFEADFAEGDEKRGEPSSKKRRIQ
ncbi:P-loop containing nucleoside triphosphate hydrolase protein [Leptodontidium sp. MPI-SDFR-AT-0119]|nr:P-loop containing nucleoside triphosphate hydrolase protein [Leptodontidium sp. MPI-SDFR-AT-0119]